MSKTRRVQVLTGHLTSAFSSPQASANKCDSKEVSKYILFGGPFTRADMVEMVMLECNVDYELRVVDTSKREQRSSDFLALNPAGQIPALITPEGPVLWETHAINMYLAERHGKNLVPAVGDAQRGEFLRWILFLAADLEPVHKAFNYPWRFVASSPDSALLPEDLTATMKSENRRELHKRFDILEKHLSKSGPYLLGKQFCLLDLSTAYWVVTLTSASFMGWNDFMAQFPTLARMTNLVTERDKLRVKFDQLRKSMELFMENLAKGKRW